MSRQSAAATAAVATVDEVTHSESADFGPDADVNSKLLGDGATGPFSSTHRVPNYGSTAASASAERQSQPNGLAPTLPSSLAPSHGPEGQTGRNPRKWTSRTRDLVTKFGSFVGPGFVIAVAYIDPGNYATDITAGASYRFRLLFVVLLSNLLAIFLQGLAIKLGTVTGLNLAEACRAFLPPWLNYVLYFFAETAIIATDVAEVIGFAIAMNILVPQISLVAGCIISVLDVMIILLFYRPQGPIKALKQFELFVLCLVIGVVICFCIELSLINTSLGDVLKGYLPSQALVERQGLYQACGILGATVMPHSLYLGSGIVQPRLREFDRKRGLLPPELDSSALGETDGSSHESYYYLPSLAAIRHSLNVSIGELAIALATFAVFVNSAILIVAGASLYGNKDSIDADIYSIYELLSKSVSPAAGTILALALLLSGVSAGIVCTITGQMVSEGALRWRISPWLRRLVTRGISIVPSIVVAAAVGRPGLNAALNASQVVLSAILPFVTAPLIYFTCCERYMTVPLGRARCRNVDGSEPIGVVYRAPSPEAGGDGAVSMVNSRLTVAVAALVWLVITILNVTNLLLLEPRNW